MKHLQSSLVDDDIDYRWIDKELIKKSFNPVDDFISRSRNAFQKHLKGYLIDNLKRLGYNFRSEEQFLNFCKDRVHRLSFEDKPNEYQFYLDYDNETEPGKYIGAYCDETSIRFESNTVIATFGRQLIQQKNL